MSESGTPRPWQHSSNMFADFILSCRRTSTWAPGEGGLFSFKFSSDPIPGNFDENIFGVREVAGRGRGGLFWATSLEKIIGGMTALIQPVSCRSEVCYPFGRKHGRHRSSETARVHHAHRRRSGGVAARGAQQ